MHVHIRIDVFICYKNKSAWTRCKSSLMFCIQAPMCFTSLIIHTDLQMSCSQSTCIVRASARRRMQCASCILFANVSANAIMSIYIYICLCIYTYIYRRLHLHLNVLCIWCNGHKYMYLTARTESLTHTSCSSCEPRLNSTH